MTQAQTVRANGFSPASEAVGDGAYKMKALSDALPKLKSQATILGLCEQGQMSFDKLEEPHKSMGDRLSKTKLMAALSAGQGSAVAFVSTWPDHVCIDACVVNPSYMVLGETAEAALLEQTVEAAKEQGISDVRLRPAYQILGDEFYANCGFYPAEGDEAVGFVEYKSGMTDDRVLCYRPAGGAAAAGEPVAAAAPAEAATAEEADISLGPVPEGFEWAGLY